MRVSFTLHPDGTMGLDIDAQPADGPIMTDLGFSKWAWMVQKVVSGGGGEVNYVEQPVSPDGGLPEAARQGE
jgi:hypothetical protein